MNRLASHATLAAAAALVLLLLGAQAASPLLYTAENTSTGAHADPATIQKRSPGDADALVPLMDDLLGQTGTLALTIKLKDYESAERDLARYSDLSRQFDRLVVTLDVSGTDVGEFQRNNRQNLDALATLLNDSRRFEELQRLEIEVLDGEQRMAVAYEGEALRQKMREGFASYASREAVTTQIAERYGANTTPYHESVGHFAEVADAADDRRESSSAVTSPLGIAVAPHEGRYGETLTIAGSYSGGAPGTRVEVYVDSRNAGAATLDANGTYACSYRIGRVLAGPHLAYAVAGSVYSEVATFEVLPANTTITLAVMEVNATAVACSGNLTAEGRPVMRAPVVIRTNDGTLVTAETDQQGAYSTEIVLAPGEYTLRTEFHAAEYPLNPSESETVAVQVRGEGLSPLPFIAALAAAAGAGWYLRRRRPEEEPIAAAEPPAEPEIVQPPTEPDIGDLPPREAATVLFRALRARLGIPETKTPRDCVRIAPDHAGFFERYERIRYAGEIPTDDELRAMETEARGGDEGAA
ncbi:MAG: hypothetical protein PWR21_1585 [Methanoculleus sp.]|nr:hypothetical protein [Methanoculleus sp.]